MPQTKSGFKNWQRITALVLVFIFSAEQISYAGGLNDTWSNIKTSLKSSVNSAKTFYHSGTQSMRANFPSVFNAAKPLIAGVDLARSAVTRSSPAFYNSWTAGNRQAFPNIARAFSFLNKPASLHQVLTSGDYWVGPPTNARDLKEMVLPGIGYSPGRGFRYLPRSTDKASIENWWQYTKDPTKSSGIYRDIKYYKPEYAPHAQAVIGTVFNYMLPFEKITVPKSGEIATAGIRYAAFAYTASAATLTQVASYALGSAAVSGGLTSLNTYWTQGRLPNSLELTSSITEGGLFGLNYAGPANWIAGKAGSILGGVSSKFGSQTIPYADDALKASKNIPIQRFYPSGRAITAVDNSGGLISSVLKPVYNILKPIDIAPQSLGKGKWFVDSVLTYAKNYALVETLRQPVYSGIDRLGLSSDYKTAYSLGGEAYKIIGLPGLGPVSAGGKAFLSKVTLGEIKTSLPKLATKEGLKSVFLPFADDIAEVTTKQGIKVLSYQGVKAITGQILKPGLEIAGKEFLAGLNPAVLAPRTIGIVKDIALFNTLTSGVGGAINTALGGDEKSFLIFYIPKFNSVHDAALKLSAQAYLTSNPILSKEEGGTDLGGLLPFSINNTYLFSLGVSAFQPYLSPVLQRSPVLGPLERWLADKEVFVGGRFAKGLGGKMQRFAYEEGLQELPAQIAFSKILGDGIKSEIAQEMFDKKGGGINAASFSQKINAALSRYTHNHESAIVTSQNKKSGLVSTADSFAKSIGDFATLAEAGASSAVRSLAGISPIQTAAAAPMSIPSPAVSFTPNTGIATSTSAISNPQIAPSIQARGILSTKIQLINNKLMAPLRSLRSDAIKNKLDSYKVINGRQEMLAYKDDTGVSIWLLKLLNRDAYFREWTGGGNYLDQGWKIHVSASSESAAQLLDVVLPVLQAAQVSHKVAKNERKLKMLNADIQQGKFITVYPSSEGEAVKIAKQLDEKISQVGIALKGPAVLTDRPFGKSGLIYYRYGEISGDLTDWSGNKVMDVREEGKFKPDFVKIDPFQASAYLKENEEIISEGSARILIKNSKNTPVYDLQRNKIDISAERLRELYEQGKVFGFYVDAKDNNSPAALMVTDSLQTGKPITATPVENLKVQNPTESISKINTASFVPVESETIEKNKIPDPVLKPGMEVKIYEGGRLARGTIEEVGDDGRVIVSWKSVYKYGSPLIYDVFSLRKLLVLQRVPFLNNYRHLTLFKRMVWGLKNKADFGSHKEDRGIGTKLGIEPYIIKARSNEGDWSSFLDDFGILLKQIDSGEITTKDVDHWGKGIRDEETRFYIKEWTDALGIKKASALSAGAEELAAPIIQENNPDSPFKPGMEVKISDNGWNIIPALVESVEGDKVKVSFLNYEHSLEEQIFSSEKLLFLQRFPLLPSFQEMRLFQRMVWGLLTKVGYNTDTEEREINTHSGVLPYDSMGGWSGFLDDFGILLKQIDSGEITMEDVDHWGKGISDEEMNKTRGWFEILLKSRAIPGSSPRHNIPKPVLFEENKSAVDGNIQSIETSQIMVDRNKTLDFNKFLSVIQENHKILDVDKKLGQIKLLEKIIEEQKNKRIEDAIHFDGRLVRILDKEAKVIFVGDVHGDSDAIVEILNETNFIERANKGENIYLVFLGDYIDRAFTPKEQFKALEIISELILRFPNKVIPLGGNHDLTNIWRVSPYSFAKDAASYYGRRGREIEKAYLSLFMNLPFAIVTPGGDFAVHGGVPGDKVIILDEIAKADINTKEGKDIIYALVWNDPEKSGGDRGTGIRPYTQKGIEEFLKVNGLKRIIRSHQPVTDGIEDVYGDGKLINIFSNNAYYKSRVGKVGYVVTYNGEITQAPININQPKILRELSRFVHSEEFIHSILSFGTLFLTFFLAIVYKDSIFAYLSQQYSLFASSHPEVISSISNAAPTFVGALIGNLIVILLRGHEFIGGGVTLDYMRQQLAAAEKGDKEAQEFLKVYKKDNPDLFNMQVKQLSLQPKTDEPDGNRMLLDGLLENLKNMFFGQKELSNGVESEFNKLLEKTAIQIEGTATFEELKQKGFSPQHKISLNGVTYYLSEPYMLKNRRPYFIGYIHRVNPETGNEEIFARTIWKSLSQSTWRVASHQGSDGSWIGKGLGEETTDAPLEIQSSLEAIYLAKTDKGKIETKEGFYDVLDEGGNMPPESFQHTIILHGEKVNEGNRVGYFKEKGNPASFTFLPGYEPDFKNGKVEEFESSSPLYGRVKSYRILSTNKKIQYLFNVDTKDRVWIGVVQATSSRLTRFGVRADLVKVDGDLLMPANEYDEQIPTGYIGELVKDRYYDASKFLNEIPVIQEFRRSVLRIGQVEQEAEKIEKPAQSIKIGGDRKGGHVEITYTKPIKILLGGEGGKELWIYAYEDLLIDKKAYLNPEIEYFIVDLNDSGLRNGKSGFKALRDNEKVVIGRNSPGRFILNDYVSGAHIKIERSGNKLIIDDLKSLNGTEIGVRNPTIKADKDGNVYGGGLPLGGVARQKFNDEKRSKLSRSRGFTDEELINAYEEHIAEQRRIPSSPDLGKIFNVHPSTIRERLNKINEQRKEKKIELRKAISNATIIEAYKKYVIEYGNYPTLEEIADMVGLNYRTIGLRLKKINEEFQKVNKPLLMTRGRVSDGILLEGKIEVSTVIIDEYERSIEENGIIPTVKDLARILALDLSIVSDSLEKLIKGYFFVGVKGGEASDKERAYEINDLVSLDFYFYRSEHIKGWPNTKGIRLITKDAAYSYAAAEFFEKYGNLIVVNSGDNKWMISLKRMEEELKARGPFSLGLINGQLMIEEITYRTDEEKYNDSPEIYDKKLKENLKIGDKFIIQDHFAKKGGFYKEGVSGDSFKLLDHLVKKKGYALDKAIDLVNNQAVPQEALEEFLAEISKELENPIIEIMVTSIEEWGGKSEKIDLKEEADFREFIRAKGFDSLPDEYAVPVNSQLLKGKIGYIATMEAGKRINKEVWENKEKFGIYGSLRYPTYFSTDYELALSHFLSYKESSDSTLIELDLSKLTEFRKVFLDPEANYIASEKEKTFIVIGGIPMEAINKIYHLRSISNTPDASEIKSVEIPKLKGVFSELHQKIDAIDKDTFVSEIKDIFIKFPKLEIAGVGRAKITLGERELNKLAEISDDDFKFIKDAQDAKDLEGRIFAIVFPVSGGAPVTLPFEKRARYDLLTRTLQDMEKLEKTAKGEENLRFLAQSKAMINEEIKSLFNVDLTPAVQPTAVTKVEVKSPLFSEIRDNLENIASLFNNPKIVDADKKQEQVGNLARGLKTRLEELNQAGKLELANINVDELNKEIEKEIADLNIEYEKSKSTANIPQELSKKLDVSLKGTRLLISKSPINGRTGKISDWEIGALAIDALNKRLIFRKASLNTIGNMAFWVYEDTWTPGNLSAQEIKDYISFYAKNYYLAQITEDASLVLQIGNTATVVESVEGNAAKIRDSNKESTSIPLANLDSVENTQKPVKLYDEGKFKINHAQLGQVNEIVKQDFISELPSLHRSLGQMSLITVVKLGLHDMEFLLETKTDHTSQKFIVIYNEKGDTQELNGEKEIYLKVSDNYSKAAFVKLVERLGETAEQKIMIKDISAKISSLIKPIEADIQRTRELKPSGELVEFYNKESGAAFIIRSSSHTWVHSSREIAEIEKTLKQNPLARLLLSALKPGLSISPDVVIYDEKGVFFGGQYLAFVRMVVGASAAFLHEISHDKIRDLTQEQINEFTSYLTDRHPDLIAQVKEGWKAFKNADPVNEIFATQLNGFVEGSGCYKDILELFIKQGVFPQWISPSVIGYENAQNKIDESYYILLSDYLAKNGNLEGATQLKQLINKDKDLRASREKEKPSLFSSSALSQFYKKINP